MKGKLFPNIKRMTTGFCVGVFCVTLSALGLRLVVFSDMAPPPEQVESAIVSNDEDGYKIYKSIYFSAPDSKADIFVTNLREDNLIKVNIVVSESGKSILTTGFINPGESIKSRQMNPYGQKLENGIYECVAEITAYDPDDVKKVIGSAETEVMVYIGEKPGSGDKDSSSKDK